MEIEEHKKAILDILLHYGEVPQVHMCIEECAELTKALLKYERYKEDTCHAEALKDNIIDELADVTIMIHQMTMLFNCRHEVEDKINYKLLRQQERIKLEKAVKL